MSEDLTRGLSKQLEKRRGEEQRQETERQQKMQQDHEQMLSELESCEANLRNELLSVMDTTHTSINDKLQNIDNLVKEFQSTMRQALDSMKKSMQSDFKNIQKASKVHKAEALKTLKWGWLKYSLPALLVFVGILAGLSGWMQYQSNQLMSLQQKISQAEQTLNDLPAGVKFAQDQSGSGYLIFGPDKPNLYRADSKDWVVKLKKQ